MSSNIGGAVILKVSYKGGYYHGTGFLLHYITSANIVHRALSMLKVSYKGGYYNGTGFLLHYITSANIYVKIVRWIQYLKRSIPNLP
jgi:hypothetical protein